MKTRPLTPKGGNDRVYTPPELAARCEAARLHWTKEALERRDEIKLRVFGNRKGEPLEPPENQKR